MCQLLPEDKCTPGVSEKSMSNAILVSTDRRKCFGGLLEVTSESVCADGGRVGKRNPRKHVTVVTLAHTCP